MNSTIGKCQHVGCFGALRKVSMLAAAISVAIAFAPMSAFAWENPNAQSDATYTWGGTSPAEDNINEPTVQFKLYKGTANILTGGEIICGCQVLNDNFAAVGINVASGNTATLNIDGGMFEMVPHADRNDPRLKIGVGTGDGDAVVNLSNGNLKIGDETNGFIFIGGTKSDGYGGAGTRHNGKLNITGGEAFAKNVWIGTGNTDATTANAALSLGGSGKLSVGKLLFKSGHNQRFDWSGGTLCGTLDDFLAQEDLAAGRTRSVTITGNPCVLDTAGHQVAIPAAVASATGNGMLALTGGGTVTFNNQVTGYTLYIGDGTTLAVHSPFNVSEKIAFTGSAKVNGTINLTSSAAKIVCDVAVANGGACSITASGGFTVPDGVESVVDRVELTLPEGKSAEDFVIAVTSDGASQTITISPAGAMVATWTGAESEDPANENNWVDIAGKPVTPTYVYTVKVAGSNVRLQIPSGSDFSCKSLDIGDCTFTDDCDWTGLAVKPTISGTANLDGHSLKLNHLSVPAGGAFSGGDGSAIVFPVSDATYSTGLLESLFIDNIENLTLSGGARIVLEKGGADSMTVQTEFNLGNAHYAEFVQSDGAVNNDCVTVIGGRTSSAGHGVYRMNGGTVTAAKDFVVGSHGKGEFVQTAGDVTLNSWFSVGRKGGGAGTYTITGGTLKNTYDKEVFVGAEGGTGTIDVRGNGEMNIYDLVLGGYDTNGSKGYLNVSGGEFKARNIGVLGARANGYGEVNQNGGKVVFGQGLTVGGDGAGVYNLQSGRLEVPNAKTLTVGGSAKTTSNGTFTQKGGGVYPGPLCVGEGAGSIGLYTQNAGEIAPWGSVYIGRNGTGTYVQNGGTHAINNNGILSLGANSTGSGQYILNGGELAVNQIVGGSGKSTLSVSGGTLTAKTEGTLLSNIGSVVFGNGGKINTAGKNISASGCGFASVSGSTFEKTGEGTLTLSAMPPADSITVSQGTLALSADCVNSVALAHRWSFGGSAEADYLADSVGGANAVKVGDSVAFSDGKVVMSGDGHRKGSLCLGAKGAGILGTGEGATVEIWAKRDAVKNWARIMEYGTAINCSWRVTWCNGTDGTKFECVCSKNGAAYGQGDVATPYENGQSLYMVLTFNNPSDGTGKPHLACAIYDADTKKSLSATSVDIVGNDLKLSDLADATFLLGASLNKADYDANATYDEVRIWHHVLSEDAVAKSVSYGPDATEEQIAEIAAAAVPCKLAVSSDAVLDLGGHTLTQPVLDVGGTIKNGNLVVTKGLVVTPGEKMTVADGATLDLSIVTEVTLKDASAAILARGWVLATSASNSIIPAEPRKLTGALKGYTLFVTNSRIRIDKSGLIIMFR